MKKFIVFSLLLFVLAGGAFAQLTFSGEAFAGFQLEKNHDQDEIVSATHRDEGAPKFNFVATAARENYGVKLDVTFQTSQENPSLNGIYGWVDFLEGDFRVAIGKISDAKWVTNLDQDAAEIFWDKVTGFRAEYKTPLEGLSVGAAFRADGTQDFDIEKFFKTFIAGASYVQPLFNAVFSYENGRNANFLFGFNYTGIDELTDAGIEIVGRNIATWDSTLVGGTIQINEKAGYRVMRPLIATFLMGQTIYGDPETKNPSLFFAPGASYRIMTGLTGSLGLRLSTDDLFEKVDLTIRPCLEYTLKGPALIYLQYELELKEMKNDNHKFGFGIDIKAF